MPFLLRTFPGHLLKTLGLCLIALLMGLAFDLGKQIADANRSDDTPRIWYAKLKQASQVPQPDGIAIESIETHPDNDGLTITATLHNTTVTQWVWPQVSAIVSIGGLEIARCSHHEDYSLNPNERQRTAIRCATLKGSQLPPDIKVRLSVTSALVDRKP